MAAPPSDIREVSCAPEVAGTTGLAPDDTHILNELNRLQEEHGFIPESELVALAATHGVSEARLQGLVSFFSSFRTRPPGRHRLSVCCGTPCFAKGASIIIDRIHDELDLDEDGTSTDGLVTVEEVGCVGLCSQAPVVLRDGQIIERVKSYQVPKIIKEMRDADARDSG